MKEKEINYTKVIEKTLLETKVDPRVRIVDGDNRTISSFLGVFNSDIALDIIKCLILNCVTNFKNDILKEISNGYLLKTSAKKSLEELNKELITLIGNFKCSKSETMPRIMTTVEFHNEFTSDDLHGIDLMYLEENVKGLGNTIKQYVDEVENQIGLVEFNKGRSSVFELNSSVSDDMLRKLHRIFTDYRMANGRDIMNCSESDFIEVLRGKGNSIRHIKIISQAALNTLVVIFEERGWFVASEHIAFWDYLAVHFCSLKGVTWIKDNLSSNKSRSNNAEIKKVFEIFDRNI